MNTPYLQLGTTTGNVFSLERYRMDNALQKSNQELSAQYDFTLEQIQLVRDVIAKNATDDEFKLFLYRCKHLGLDPLKPGQIFFIKYGSGPGTIVVGIEGARSKAHRTGKLTGIKRGVLRNPKGDCVGAWAEVFRQGWVEPAREEVSLHEYSSGKGNWLKMPETMIKKVAEMAALRMAFPDDLGGVYAREEFNEEAIETQSVPVVPAPQPVVVDERLNAIKEVFAFAKENKVHVDDMKDFIKHVFSKDSAKDLTLDECKEMRDAILSGDLMTKPVIDEVAPWEKYNDPSFIEAHSTPAVIIKK